MAVVTNPLPVRVPREVARETAETLTLSRLQVAVADCVSLIRVFFSGRLLEWHEDVSVDTVATPILHGLRRRPWGIIRVRDSAGVTLVTPYDLWTETSLVLQTTARSSSVSFILF